LSKLFRIPVISALLFLSVGQGLRAFGALMHAVLSRDALSHAPIPAAILVASSMAAAMGVFFWQKWKLQAVHGALAVLLCAPIFLYGYKADMDWERKTPEANIFGMWAQKPGAKLKENNPLRPAVTYTMNRHGFRDPDWSLESREDTFRILFIGDSNVFGSGVEGPDTLSEQSERALEKSHPGKAFECINLGIPGDNIASHIELYLRTVPVLKPDAVIIALFLFDDAAHWDKRAERKERAEPSLFSFVSYILGNGAAQQIFYRLRLHADEVADDHYRMQIGRLTQYNQANESPSVLVFPWNKSNESYRKPWLEQSGISFLNPLPFDRSNFIEGDGHPNPKGTRLFGEYLAKAITERLLKPPPTAPNQE